MACKDYKKMKKCYVQKEKILFDNQGETILLKVEPDKQSPRFVEFGKSYQQLLI